jgi:hypothetical protein
MFKLSNYLCKVCVSKTLKISRIVSKELEEDKKEDNSIKLSMHKNMDNFYSLVTTTTCTTRLT